MNQILTIVTIISLVAISSCSPKEQISVFDSNMVVRNTAETEEIAKTIRDNKNTCRENKEAIERLSQ